METVTFTSSQVPPLSITLCEDARIHIQRHFAAGIVGSKFIFDSPDALFQTIVDHYSQLVNDAVINEYGCKTVSITFPFVVGYSNVVSLDELNEEERSTMRFVLRGESTVRCVFSPRVFPTHDCQLILDDNNHIVTVYPGELAPPLPDSPDIHDEYWDNHVFIEPAESNR